MSKPARIRLCGQADVDSRPEPGCVRRGLDLPLYGGTLRIDVDVPDRRTRLADVVPLARSICDRVVAAAIARTADDGKPVSCRKGCDACCSHLLIAMSEPEAFRLMEDIKRLGDGPRGRMLDDFAEWDRAVEQAGMYDAMEHLAEPGDDSFDRGAALRELYRRVRRTCPMLRAGQCSMYPSRPMVCREFMATSDPALCAQCQEDRVYMPVAMFRVLAEWSGRLAGGAGKGRFVLLPTLLRWYYGKSARAERTWRGPMMVESFLDSLGRQAAAAAENVSHDPVAT